MTSVATSVWITMCTVRTGPRWENVRRTEIIWTSIVPRLARNVRAIVRMRRKIATLGPRKGSVSPESIAIT